MAKVSRPPILRVGHEGVKVLDNGVEVETLEFLGVVEFFAHRIGQRGVLVKDLKVQLVRPPVTVLLCGSCARERALCFGCHILLLRIAGGFSATVMSSRLRLWALSWSKNHDERRNLW